MPLVLGQVVGDREPQRLEGDEDVTGRADRRVVEKPPRAMCCKVWRTPDMRRNKSKLFASIVRASQEGCMPSSTFTAAQRASC
jgi:hypothetical protein